MSTQAEVTTYRQLFAERYAEVKELLADLPAAALLWKPFEQSPWQGPSNSLGLIIAHTVSSTVYLLRRAEYARSISLRKFARFAHYFRAN